MRRLLALATSALALAACGDRPNAAGDSGVRGVVMRGPFCPVQTVANPCPDEPFATDVRVLSADGQVLQTVRSGSDGRFVLRIAAGHYILMTESGKPIDVIVHPHSFVKAVVEYDTGIR